MFKLLKRTAATLIVGSILLTAGGAGAEAAADPEQLALGQKYFDEIQMPKLMEQSFAAIGPALNAQMLSRYEDQLSVAQMAALKSATDETSAELIKSLEPKLEAMMIPIIARTFTKQELTDLVAFYATPSAQSMIAKMPQVSQAMASHIAEIMPDQDELDQTVQQKYCAKIKCRP